MYRKYNRSDVKETNITKELITSILDKKYGTKKEKEKLKKKHSQTIDTMIEIMSLNNNKTVDRNINEALSLKSKFPEFYDQLLTLILDTIKEHISEGTGKAILRRSQVDALYLKQGYLFNYQFCEIIINVLGLQNEVNFNKQEDGNTKKRYSNLLNIDYNKTGTEKEYTELLLKYSHILMNPNTYIFNVEKLINERRTDLVIYNEENKMLYIVEIEKICHSFSDHIIPQIGDFIRAIKTNNLLNSFHRIIELINDSDKDSLGKIITDQTRGEISRAITKRNIKVCVIFDKVKNHEEERKIKSIKDVYFVREKDILELYYPNTNSLITMNNY